MFVLFVLLIVVGELLPPESRCGTFLSPLLYLSSCCWKAHWLSGASTDEKIYLAGQLRGLHDEGGGAGESGPHRGDEEQVGGQRARTRARTHAYTRARAHTRTHARLDTSCHKVSRTFVACSLRPMWTQSAPAGSGRSGSVLKQQQQQLNSGSS